MKIRDRLALSLTLSAAGIFLVLSLLVYFGAAASRKEHFFNGLQEELSRRGQEWKRGNEFYAETAAYTRDSIPGENGRVVTALEFSSDKSGAAEDSLKATFPAAFTEALFKEGNARFQAGETEGVGQLFEEEGRRAVIVISGHDRHGKALLDKLKKLLAGSFLLSLPLLYFLGRLSAGYILKPVARKIQEARQTGASGLHLRVDGGSDKDETGQLAIAFNEMLDRLEASVGMQRNFISNASHELRNPLTAIIGEAEVCLERKRTPEEYIESLRNISREADRLDALVDSLLSLAKTGFDETEPAREEIRLDEALLEARLKANKSWPGNRIKIDFSGLPDDPDRLTINGNPGLLHVAFTNLMENACKFSDKQEVVVSLSVQEDSIQLRIADKGVGIPQEDIQNIFQPFYRARNARAYKGFGIGLSLTDKIIGLHNGQMHIFSEEGKGTTVEVIFQT